MINIKNKNIIITSSLSFFLPLIAGAQFSLQNSTFSQVIDQIIRTINAFWPALIGLAFLMFFWGMSKFLLNAGNKGELEKGRSYMLWAAVALFVLFGVRSIIGYISYDLGLGPANPSESWILFRPIQ